MKTFTVKFYKENTLICTCTKKADSLDEAMINAEWALICKYPNVEYDTIVV